jgi:hypothetical protein
MKKEKNCWIIPTNKLSNLVNHLKIIIPKEEPKSYIKSETKLLGIEFTLKDDSKQFVPNPKEEFNNFVKCKCSNSLEDENCIRNCGHGLEEPKQETLEKASKKAWLDYTRNHSNFRFSDVFALGAKWQQESMYNEEEVKRIAFSAMDYKNDSIIIFTEKIKWFEQIKKK